MANKPFLAVHTNIIDESTTTTTPSVIGANPVLITQGQHRRTFDTLTTSIQGNPMASFITNFQQPQQMNYCPCLQRNDNLQANAQFMPGGVLFTFGGQNPSGFINQQYNNPFAQGLSCDQQIALKQLEQYGLEYLLLQERLKKNPFILDFHYNKNTSTSDLLNGPSMSQPDFNAASAFAANNVIQDYPMTPPNHYSKARQLNLPENHKDKQSPSDTYVSACDDKQTNTEERKNSKQNVTFKEESENQQEIKKQEDEKTEEKTNNSCSCSCDTQTNEPPPSSDIDETDNEK